MRRLVSRLAFVHRTLWQRDAAYRWAALLGPPPVIGVALAALCLAAFPRLWATATTQAAGAPWAHGTRPPQQEAEPFQESTLPLPARDANGRYHGLTPGWRGEIHPMSVDATQEVSVSGSVLASFSVDQPDIALQRVVDAGPPSGLFMARAQSFFVVRTPGLYTFSLRLARTGTQSADCVARLNSRRHQMIRHITLNVDKTAVLTYPTTQFRLEPGLLEVGVGVGCWRGEQVLGAGDVTVMVRRPGELALGPAAADELLRPAP